jgi:hypothetical protein
MSENNPSSLPKSFYWIAGAALVWNLLGLMAYVAQVSMSPEALAALPDAERALYEGIPTWVTSAFAIAVNGGVLGSLLLVLRKALALPVLVVSLLAVLVQVSYNILMTEALAVLGPASAIGPLVLVVIAVYLVWFAGDAKKKGWIS